MRKVPVEAGEPLRLEIEAFLEAVRERSEPAVTVEEGRAALALALEINAAIGRMRSGRGCSGVGWFVHVGDGWWSGRFSGN